MATSADKLSGVLSADVDASEAAVRAVLDLSPAAMIVVDPAGCVLAANEAAASLLACRAENGLVGSDVRD